MVVGLVRVGDHAHGCRGNAGFGADSRGKGCLKAGADGNAGVGNLSAGGAVDQVDAMRAEEARKGNGFVDGPAALGPIGGGDADEERQVRRPAARTASTTSSSEADAVLEAAAVGVGALIGERREELVNQVAVGGVDLDEVKAGGEGAMRGLGEGVDDGVDSGLIEGLRYCVAGGEGDGAGRDGLPAAFLGRWSSRSPANGRRHAGFAAGVGELDSGTHALRVDEASDALQVGNVRVFPDAQVGGRDAAFRDDGGGLKHDEACAALGAAAEVDKMPVVGEAVLRGVLAHGRDADAVGEK